MLDKLFFYMSDVWFGTGDATVWTVFFVVFITGVCYCIGQFVYQLLMAVYVFIGSLMVLFFPFTIFADRLDDLFLAGGLIETFHRGETMETTVFLLFSALMITASYLGTAIIGDIIQGHHFLTEQRIENAYKKEIAKIEQKRLAEELDARMR